MMAISLHDAPFNPWALITQHQDTHLAPGSYGATASFVGTMRDFNEGQSVTTLFLEHYPGMTEKQLHLIQDEAVKKWEVLDVFIAHRIGEVSIAEPIVVTAVWAPHRAAAFEANRFLMEALKTRAPFWKKETHANKSRWVDQNTPG